MLQSLRNRRNRKGFTLAELLIVVAIIAVLVAIAVPLFVGQITKAEESVKKANIRTVRGEAVIYILSMATPEGAADKADENNKNIIFDTDGSYQDYIQVETTVSSTGTIGELTFSKGEKGDDSCVKDGNGGYLVTVIIDTTNDLSGKASK